MRVGDYVRLTLGERVGQEVGRVVWIEDRPSNLLRSIDVVFPESGRARVLQLSLLKLSALEILALPVQVERGET